jgi:homoserine O-acetyltransferase/O-succinyltransferase
MHRLNDSARVADLIDSGLMKIARVSLRCQRLLTAAIGIVTLSIFSLSASAEGELKSAQLGACKLDSGKQIEYCHLGYRIWGKLNDAGSNAILIPSWFGGNSANWANNVGPGKMLDPSRYFIIAVDALGNGVSSSPSNSKTQPRMAFPAFTIGDMVRAEYRLATETLHLKHLRAVMGISMGGMQTFEWMVDYPDFMDVAIPIVGSPRLTSYDLLLWHAEEDATRDNPAWKAGNYAKNPALPIVDALHEMNLTSPSHYVREVTLDRFASHYAGYGADSQGVDANNRLYQLEAMIHQDVAHGGSMEAAAKRVKAKVLVVPSEQDHMVNPGPAMEFARLLGAKQLLLTSDCGHLATSCEADKLNPAVAAFLAGK